MTNIFVTILMFATTALSFGYYFSAILPQEGPDVDVENVVLFGRVLVIMVVVQIAGHIAIAIAGRPEETDERDRLIALKGVRNAVYLLGTGVIVSIGCALITEGNFIFVHVLFAFMVLAQLLENASQLYYYRRGP